MTFHLEDVPKSDAFNFVKRDLVVRGDSCVASLFVFNRTVIPENAMISKSKNSTP